MKNLKAENLVLIAILVIGAILRFYNYAGWSLSNDELSAITRLNFSSFSEMIEKGVKLDDMHPMGVQVFLWGWTHIMGLSDQIIRFPFVIAGCLSVLLVYLIASTWFNKTSALFSTAVFATLQFPILYSQLARPYSPGLFFSLLFTYAFTQIYFYKKEKKNLDFYVHHLILVVAGAASMYTHYFSFMLVGIVGIFGLFLLDKTKRFLFLVCGIAMFLLYIPNLDVFLYQFGVGGLGGEGGWLGVPRQSAIIDFIFFGLNESVIVVILAFTAVVFSMMFFWRNIQFSKWHLLTLLFAFLPAFIAYFYSVYKNPVFQSSILLFGFPYFIMFIFSFIPNLKLKPIVTLCLFLVTATVAYSSIIEKKFYSIEHFGVFKDLVESSAKYSQKFGAENIELTTNVIHKEYIEYYLNQLEIPVEYVMYQTTSPESFITIDSIMSNSKKKYFLHSWSNTYHAPEIEERIKRFFPYVVARDKHYNSGLVVYSKSKIDKSDFEIPISFEEKNSFEKSRWSNDEKLTKQEVNNLNTNYFSYVDSTIEYSTTFVTSAKNMALQTGKTLIISFDVRMPELPLKDETMLVVSFENAKGESKVWRNLQFNPFVNKTNSWTKLYFGYSYQDEINPDDILKVYVYNPKRKYAELDNFVIKVYDGTL
jgi:hypothetical protein